MERAGIYFYMRRGRTFRIYRRHDNEDGTGGTAAPVAGEHVFYTQQDARDCVYELNGWRPKK